MSGNVHRIYPNKDSEEEPDDPGIASDTFGGLGDDFQFVGDGLGTSYLYGEGTSYGRVQDQHSPPSLASTPQAPHDSTMSDNRIGAVERSVSKLEGIMDGFRAVPQLAVTTLGIVMGALAIVVTVGIFALNGVTSQVKDLGGKVDAIPKQITEEFRAMRAETAAQTSAIANSITAARQFQPQVVVMPMQPQPPAQPSNASTPNGGGGGGGKSVQLNDNRTPVP
jgi:hypothetical protein